jgi:peptidoglycan/LPS O-acetylase OafA/YrhL
VTTASASSTVDARMPWNLDRGRAAGEMGYLPGLDGLRAIAIIGVLLYHAGIDWVPGGFLGVDVFFVLSGFLITSLILEEYDRAGRIDFKRFYIRRARRLLPAVFVLLIAVGIAVLLLYRDALSAFREDALATLLYLNNWWYIVVDQSYFESMGRPPLLKHLWSLSVEEQFYLIWPAVALLLVRRGGRPLVRRVAIFLAVASTAWMAYLAIRGGYPVDADPSRAYFGTDSHMMGLLIGAALATVWRPGRLSANIPRGAQMLVTGNRRGDDRRYRRLLPVRGRVHALAVPRRFSRPGGLHRCADRCSYASSISTRASFGHRAASLPGAAFVRHLSVALADLHGDATGHRRAVE